MLQWKRKKGKDSKHFGRRRQWVDTTGQYAIVMYPDDPYSEHFPDKYIVIRVWHRVIGTNRTRNAAMRRANKFDNQLKRKTKET
jgi:hypothetical protein